MHKRTHLGIIMHLQSQHLTAFQLIGNINRVLEIDLFAKISEF